MLATLRSGVVALTALLFASSPCQAQTEAALIRAGVKDGQKVAITTDEGDVLGGRVETVGADALSLRSAGTRSDIRFDRIVRIDRPNDGLGNGALIGLGTGAALALVTAAADDDNGHCPQMYYCTDVTPGGYAILTALGGGLGAAIGVGVDALIHHDRVIYRRPGGKRLTASPTVGRGARGVAVSLSW